MNGPPSLFVFRAFVRERVGPHHQVTINVPTTDLPLLGFLLLMVCTVHRQAGLPPRDRHA